MSAMDQERTECSFDYSYDRTADRTFDRTIDTLVLAREAAEDDAARIYAHLERELQKRQEDAEAASEREREAEQTQRHLRQRILDLERQLTDANLKVDTTRIEVQTAQTAAVSAANHHNTTIKILKEKLAAATERSEMYEKTVSDLEQEMARREPAITSVMSDPVSQIYSQELQDAIIENTRLEQQLARAHVTIQDLKVTELVNETLTGDKLRLRAEIDALRGVEDENARLAARIASFERQARQWAAFLEPNEELASPQQLTRHLAETRARAAATKKILETTQQIVETQRNATREAMSLQSKMESQQQQLLEAADREAKLEIRLAALKTHVELLEGHLADKPLPDTSTITALVQRLDAMATPTTKRQLSPTTDDNLDKLATKLMDAEKRAQDATSQLDLTKKELAAAAAAARSAADATPAPVAAVMEVKGSNHDKSIQSKLELLESLVRENQALKDQLQGTGLATVPLESIAVLNTRLETTKRDAEEKYQGLDQLLKGFRSKVAQTKGAERSIFGYELELRNNSTCLVRSEYALEGIDKSIEKSLNFFECIYDPQTKRYADLSYTSSVRPYEDVYRYWIQERKFLPGFLAAVLLQNYEKYGQ